MGRESKIRKMRREGLLEPVKEERRGTPKWVKIVVGVLIIVILSFVGLWAWGQADKDVAARVGKEVIKNEEVQNQFNYYVNMYKQYGIDLNNPKYASMRDNLHNSVLNSLINQSLLVQYAKAHHLKIDMAKFNKNMEDQINQIIEQGKKENGEKIFQDSITARYGSMDAYKNYLKKVLTPYVERPLLAQAALDAQYKNIKITDADVKKFWDSTYQVNAEHFLLKVDKDAPKSVWQEKEKEANELYKEFIDEKKKEGSKFNFASFAKKKADELNKKEAKSGKEVARYENLGFFSRGQMVKPFEDACFDPNAKPGDIIGPVKTEFGYHIIHIIAKKPESSKYDEPAKVKVKIAWFKFKANDKKSKDNAKMSANSVAIQLKRGMSFDRAVELSDDDPTLKKNKGLMSNYITEKTNPEIFKVAYNLKVGETAGPIETSQGYAVIEVVDKKAPVKASLDNKDIYEKAKNDLLSQKKQEVEKEFLEQLKKQYKVRTTDPWKEIVAFFEKHFGKQWDSFVAWWNKATGKTASQNQGGSSNNGPAPVIPSNNSNNSNSGGNTQPLKPINGGG
jgi:parvulin-like peptidyl-prolyl isomerase